MSTSSWVRLAGLIVGFYTGGPMAFAEHRVALLIGNSRYPGAALASPPNDIRGVGEALRQRGFRTTELENLDATQIRDAVKAFGVSVPVRGTALLYFSGYVVPSATFRVGELAKDSLLLPLEGDPANPRALLTYKTEVQKLLQTVATESDVPPLPGVANPRRQGGGASQIFLLDGCYQHPARAAATGGGLPKPATLVPASLVVHSAPYGETVAPPREGLSPFAQKLIEALRSSRPLNEVLTSLSPATESSPGTDWSFLAAPAPQVVASQESLIPGKRPGEEWLDSLGLSFCWCPPGSFTMGSPAGESERNANEALVDVEFPHGFWMAKYEFTRRDVLATLGAVNLSTGTHKLQPLNRINAALVDSRKIYHPSTAQLIVDKLNASAPSGWYYDVPTEAEWEYAARAGSRTAYWFGDNPADLARYGNFADRSLRQSASNGELANGYFGRGRDEQTGLFSYAHKVWDDAQETVALVGSYPPNPWGLHDMHGNVSEITSDPYHPFRVVEAEPVEHRGLKKPVLKGGSWASPYAHCRSAYRAKTSDIYTENYEGLRLVVRQKREARTCPEPRWFPLIPSEVSTSAGSAATIEEDGTVWVKGLPTNESYRIKTNIPKAIEVRAIRLEALSDPSLPKGGPGRSNDGYFALAEFGCRTGVPSEGRASLPLRFLHVKGASEAPAQRIEHLMDGKPDTFWSLRRSIGKDSSAVFFVGLPFVGTPDGAKWTYPSKKDLACRLPGGGEPIEFLLEYYLHFTLGKFRLSVTPDEVLP